MPRHLVWGPCAVIAMLASLVVPLPAADTGAAIVPLDARLEVLWNAGEFTEGVAVAADGMIYFSDIPEMNPGRVLKFDPRTRAATVYSADSGKSNGLEFDARRRLLAACGANAGRRALCEIRPDGRVIPLISRFNGRLLNSPNDLALGPDGAIYFTDPRYVGPEPVELDQQSLFRFHRATSRLEQLETGITKPNGLTFSPDGTTLYVAETDNGTLDGSIPPPEGTKRRMTLNAFALQADGTLGPRRVLVDFGQQLGIDGMTVDSQGRIYAAVRSDDRFGILVYSPQGTELAHIPTPALPTNVCFGVGEQASVLYITAGGGLYQIRLNSRRTAD